MRIKALIGRVFIAGLLAACGGGSGSGSAPELPTGAALRAEVERVRASNGLPGLSVVVVDKDRIETVTTGKRNVNGEAAITDTDQFQLGSLTKSTTAMLLARLVEQKKLRWDATMAQIFPAWSGEMHPSLRNVTVAQLLQHRSGIKRRFEDADGIQLRPHWTGDVTTDRTMIGRYILQQAPELTPNTKYLYSNNGYIIAGLIAEAVAGQPYQALMEQEVFGPLHMTASFGLPEDGGAGALSGHVLSGATWQPAQYSADFRQWLSWNYPAGGLMLSMADYGTYLHEQLIGLEGKSTRLGKDTFTLIHTPVEGYGFGWHVEDDPVLGHISRHDGTIQTYFSLALIVPGTRRAVAVSCNCYGTAATDQANALVRFLAGAKAP